MNLLFLVNPVSGRGRAALRANRAIAFAHSQVHQTTTVSDSSLSAALASAREHLSNQRFDALIVSGGDGSVHDALKLASEFQVPFSVISSGTGNDFARVTGVHKLSPEDLMALVFATKPQSYDLGLIRHKGGEEVFIQVLSTGFDSVVNARANSYKVLSGKFKYVVATVREIFPFRARAFDFTIDGVKFHREAMLLAVANGPNYGGGMMVVPHAIGQDGKLDLLLLNKVSKLEFLRVFPKVFSGKHVNHPAVEFFSGREISISASVVAYADGEYISDLPISISVLPGEISTWIKR